MGPLAAAAFGLRACLLAPDALTVGQASKLAGDLLAFRLVLTTDLPDKCSGALADISAPRPGFVVGCEYHRWLGIEDVLRILLELSPEIAALLMKLNQQNTLVDMWR